MKGKIYFFSVVTVLSCSCVMAQAPTNRRLTMDSSGGQQRSIPRQPVNVPKSFAEVITDKAKTVYLNYGLLNYIVTRDDVFCNDCYKDIRNLKKRSTLISQTSERQRNIFFGILLSKIDDRKKRL